MGKVYFSPTVFAFVLLLSVILSASLASRKRIGSVWGFFFLLWWLVPGVVFILLSPPKNEITLPDPKTKLWDRIAGGICLALCLGALKAAFLTPDYMQVLREDSPLYNVFAAVYSGGLAYYLLTRFQRNTKLYLEHTSAKKDEINEAGEISINQKEAEGSWTAVIVFAAICLFLLVGAWASSHM